MGTKEIIGFKTEEKNFDSICPNCNKESLCIPIRGVNTGFFKYEIHDYYTCEHCGCKWRVQIR